MVILCRDCTHGQGETCKGDAVNFGGWDEFSKKNGVFEFPKDPSVSAANVTLTFTKKPTKYNYQTYSLLNGGFIPGNTENGGPLEIKQGDILAARCLYTNKNNKPVKFGAKQSKRREASVKSTSSVIVPDPVVLPAKRKRTQKRSLTASTLPKNNNSIENPEQSSTSSPEKMPTADEFAFILPNRMRSNEPKSQEQTSQHQPSLAELVNPPAQQTQASTSTMRNPRLVIPPMPCSSSTIMNTVSIQLTPAFFMITLRCLYH
ncbi:unnamed protein product [Mytilus edulis]|uniref:Uncharacterized protein n=1 Tax=Mytilus edulis TaxID=6550 RepID=A0A8S3SSQ3_MYTED|nr:unnamed protein product [Mytilus edulis]